MSGKEMISRVAKSLFLFMVLVISSSIILKRMDSYFFNEFQLLMLFGVGSMALGSEIKTIQILYLYHKEVKNCSEECSSCNCH